MDRDHRIRVMSVDDHPVMLEGIAALVNNQPDMVLAAHASNSRDALQVYREERPDVTLMDLRMPDGGGIDAMIGILKEFPDARIILLTMFEGDAEIRRALKNGAYAYILKSTPPKEMVEIIRRVHSGKKYVHPTIAVHLAEYIGNESLTDREVEVLRHVADGKRNREIAGALFISEETVKVHLKHIMDKLTASDRTQAVSIAVRRGIIEL